LMVVAPLSVMTGGVVSGVAATLIVRVRCVAGLPAASDTL